jgi:hypothetical protein
VVRLQSDRVGRRPPGSRYEDRTFGRDADERKSTAHADRARPISCTTPESVSTSITTASRRSATGTTSSGSTWAAVSNSFSPMPPAPPASTMSARSERSPALSSAAAISSVPTIRMRGLDVAGLVDQWCSSLPRHDWCGSLVGPLGARCCREEARRCPGRA